MMDQYIIAYMKIRCKVIYIPYDEKIEVERYISYNVDINVICHLGPHNVL